MTNDVQFDEGSYNQVVYNDAPSGLVGLVIRMGLAEDEEKAGTVLMVVLILAIVVTIATFIFFILPLSSTPKVDQTMIQRINSSHQAY